MTLTLTALTGEKGQHRNGHGDGGGDLGEGDEDGGQGSCHLILHLQGADPQGGDAHLGHPRHQAKLKTLHHLVLHTNSQHQHFIYSVSAFSKKLSPGRTSLLSTIINMDGEQGLILIQDSLRTQGLRTKRLEGRWWGWGWGSMGGGGEYLGLW